MLGAMVEKRTPASELLDVSMSFSGIDLGIGKRKREQVWGLILDGMKHILVP